MRIRLHTLSSIAAKYAIAISAVFAPTASYALEGILKVSFRNATNVSLGAYTHLRFPSWGQRTHFGNDVLADCGSAIYAPGSGLVEDVVRPNTANFNTLGNAVVIRHAGAGRGGADLFSLFLHMEASPPVSIGDLVTSETAIGRVGTTGSANGICHSHVELRYFAARFSTEYSNIYADGDVSSTSYAHDNWENPNAYSINLIPMSVFDGSGSLVDPTRLGTCSRIGNFGCSRDVVRLHPHSLPSTGTFQILSQAGVCDYVRVEGLLSAYISVKRWNETYPGNTDGLSTIYKAVSLPAHVKVPSNDWVLLTVTSTAPVPANQYRDVTLTCVQGTFSQLPPGNQISNIAPPVATRATDPSSLLVTLESDFHWSGSGSLISISGNNSFSATIGGFGRDRDEAIKLNSKKSLLSFQAYSDGTICRSVRITDAAGSTGAVVETSTKVWTDSLWSQPISGQLPITVTIPGAGYWIIKVRPAAIGWQKLRAVCI